MGDVDRELQEGLEGEDTPSGHPFAVGVGWPGDLSSPCGHHTSGPTTASWASVKDAEVNLHLENQSAFELFGELFHVFISYRVTSEGTKLQGNSFARNLYKHLHTVSSENDDFSIPSVGCGQYPRFVQEMVPGAIGNKPNVAKVFLDEQCLPDGQEWRFCFVKGLAVSMVAVLLVLVPPPIIVMLLVFIFKQSHVSMVQLNPSFPHIREPHSQSSNCVNLRQHPPPSSIHEPKRCFF